MHKPAEQNQEFYGQSVRSRYTVHNEEGHRQQVRSMTERAPQPNSRQPFRAHCRGGLPHGKPTALHGTPLKNSMPLPMMLRTRNNIKQKRIVDETLRTQIPASSGNDREQGCPSVMDIKVNEDDSYSIRPRICRNLFQQPANEYGGMGQMAEQMADYYADKHAQADKRPASPSRT